MDKKTERYIINRFVSIPKLLDSIGKEYRTDGNFYCIFHHNTNTPSAHLYIDEYGSRIWCFSEHRMYGAWDIYKTFIPKVSTSKLAELIYSRLSEEDKKALLKNLDMEEADLDGLPYQSSLNDFKHSKISFSELLNLISNTYN